MDQVATYLGTLPQLHQNDAMVACRLKQGHTRSVAGTNLILIWGATLAKAVPKWCELAKRGNCLL